MHPQSLGTGRIAERAPRNEAFTVTTIVQAPNAEVARSMIGGTVVGVHRADGALDPKTTWVCSFEGGGSAVVVADSLVAATERAGFPLRSVTRLDELLSGRGDRRSRLDG